MSSWWRASSSLDSVSFVFWQRCCESVAQMNLRSRETRGKNTAPLLRLGPGTRRGHDDSDCETKGRKEEAGREKANVNVGIWRKGNQRHPPFHHIAHSRHASRALWPLAPRTLVLIVCDGWVVPAAVEDGEQTKGKRDGEPRRGNEGGKERETACGNEIAAGWKWTVRKTVTQHWSCARGKDVG